MKGSRYGCPAWVWESGLALALDWAWALGSGSESALVSAILAVVWALDPGSWWTMRRRRNLPAAGRTSRSTGE